MKKTVRNILILVAVLAVLGGAALALFLLPSEKDADGSGESSAVSSTVTETVLKKEASEFSSLAVENGEDSYVILPKGDGYTLEGYEEFDLLSAQLQHSVTSLLSLEAEKNLGSQSDLDAFGLEGDSAASVTLKFKDGSEEKLVLGDTAAETNGRYLLKDGTVYIVPNISANLYATKFVYFNKEMYTILDRTTEVTDDEGNTTTQTDTDLLYSMKLSGTNFPQEIQVEYGADRLSGYVITAPVTAESGGDELTGMITAMKTLTADSVVGAKLTPELLEEFGLDEPEAIVEFDLNSQKHKLQAAAKEDGSGYYVLLDDQDVIYTVGSDAIPWAATTLMKLRMSYIWLNNVQDVDRLTLTVSGKDKYSFDITRTVNEEKSTETATQYDLSVKNGDGKDIEYETYRSLYQKLISVTVLSSDLSDYEDESVLKIEYHRFDGGGDTVEFRAAGEDRYAALLNGRYNGLVRKGDVDKILPQIPEAYQ